MTIGKFTGALALACIACWPTAHADVVTDWNAITVSCVQGGANPAKRGGPAGLLDIALVQAAVHDAVQAIQGRFEAYEYENKALRGRGSPDAAAAAAAYDVLSGLYPGAPCLANVVDPAVTYVGDKGLQAGSEAATALLPLYRPLIVLPTDPFLGSDEIGQWRPTPGVTQGQGTFLAVTAPFAMKRPNQFRPAPPPSLKSLTYLRDYYEVMVLGSAASTVRTPEQTDMGHFWSVNFFSQWNEAVRAIAKKHLNDVGDSARLFALTAFAAADSQISIYEAKYLYNYWRPITAIQHGDDDGNWLTRGDASWTPQIPTPPYPEFSSGANCLTAAITTVMQKFFKTDRLEFSVWTTNKNAMVNPRTYERFSDVQREMVEVRITQGVHFRTADEVGRRQGARIGEWTFSNYLRPVKRTN